MNLQIIKSMNGHAEYVLLPIGVYHVLQKEIQKTLASPEAEAYVPFDPADYVENPIALARIKAGLSQKKLAKRMKVTQAYISKLERQEKVTAKMLHKVTIALARKAIK